MKAVKEFVKRLLDPRGNKGAWTAEEDAQLLRAYALHPNEWTKIAMAVDRTESDCRDRYRGELAHKATRKAGTSGQSRYDNALMLGHWTKEEENKLVETIKEANVAIGNDALSHEAPWDVVVKKMEGTRSRQQCRKKWYAITSMYHRR